MLSKNRNGYFWHGKPITAEEYANILAMLRNPPTAPDGFAYRLTEGLEWDLYALPEPDPDPELTDEEALNIILGGNA